MPAKKIKPDSPKAKKNHRNFKHGHTWKGGCTRTYAAWYSMRNRCYYKPADSYSRYGGRGITVCDRWRYSFQHFLDDMGECPPELTLERRNTNGNYTPSNCVWDTEKVQSRNRSSNHLLEFNGESRPICEWAEIVNINESTILTRIKMGWTVNNALTRKARKPTRFRMFGRTKTIYGWWKESGIRVNTVLGRIKLGWSLKRALTTLPKGGIWSP